MPEVNLNVKRHMPNSVSLRFNALFVRMITTTTLFTQFYVSWHFTPMWKIFAPLCCLFVFDMRILIAPLESSNSSFKTSENINQNISINDVDSVDTTVMGR
jgi:hypothetical protein